MMVSLLALVSTSIASPISGSSIFQECIGNSITSQFLLPTSPAFNARATGQRARVDRHPAIVFLATSEEQVVKAIKCSLQAHLLPVPRGGGHSYEGFSSQYNAVVIDTAAINYVKVISSDVVKQTGIAKVGGGARLGNVYLEIWKQGGFTFNAGTCPTVGIGGHTAGGGYGMSARQYGLAADRILSMRVVLGNGQVVTASPTENKDLYWALRGGGAGSFGVVTEFTLHLYKSPENAMFRITFDKDTSAKALLAYLDHFITADARLTSQFEINSQGTIFRGQFAGPKAELERILIKSGLVSLHGIRENVRATCNALGAKAFIWGGDCSQVAKLGAPVYLNDKDYGKSKSDYSRKKFTPAFIHSLVDHVNNGPNGWIQFEVYGGKLKEFKNTDTPFSHRDVLFSMQYAVSLVKDEPKTSPNYKWLYKLESLLSPHVSGEHYINYCDLDIGPNYGVAYWGKENFERLKQIKKRYDPQNLFKNEQSVPLPSQ